MGRRKKKKIIKKVKRKIPKIFLCPNCGKQTVFVEINKKENKASVRCASCGISAELQLRLSEEPVDSYNAFVDAYFSGKL